MSEKDEKKWSYAKRKIMALRRAQSGGGQGGSRNADALSVKVQNEAKDTVAVYDVPLKKRGRRKGEAMATVGTRTSGMRNPTHMIAKSISDALDPTTAPGKVTAFKDMTPEEQAEMRRLYEKPGK